ncbi:hypothetical protein [Streptomyces gobiensis]|uniref:hypothetical protein n=1 Tax=Streptomyces gobiensis TaxID=2875706 RepID=UPI001E44C80A|nr:hypothetical protein [Streptomyces gobiensis]UGY91683.1 hypothetical protein test1122_08060 [Streptomyces gobiensis]
MPKHSMPLDGDASAMIRPYILAHEREQQRQDRELLAALTQFSDVPMSSHAV